MTKAVRSVNQINRQLGLKKNLWTYHTINTENKKYLKYLLLTIKQKKLQSKHKRYFKYVKYTILPGEHGRKKKKLQSKRRFSKKKTREFIFGQPKNKMQNLDYTLNLNAKQKFRKYYGDINEKQFKKIVLQAKRYKKSVIKTLIILLEQRLDCIIFRMNFASSIFNAQQLITHGHILVNKKKVNIYSFHVKPGDLIEVKKSSYNLVFKNIYNKFKHLNLKETQNKILSIYPNYIEINYKTLSGILLYSPYSWDVTYHNNKMHLDLKNLFRYYF